MFLIFKERINCSEKLNKLNDTINECYDVETLDDLANIHVAQLSADNITLWYTYMDYFTLNGNIGPYLALDYHTKRVRINMNL